MAGQSGQAGADRKRRYRTTAILWILIWGMAGTGVLLMRNAMQRGAESAEAAYERTKKETAETVYEKFYGMYYKLAERENHVRNTAVIRIEGSRERTTLEVLKAYDVAFIAEEPQDNDENITVWLEVPGEAAFAVDLSVSEFLADNIRGCVIVRAPAPEITMCAIDNGNIQRLYWDNDWRNDSISRGEALARRHEKEADRLLREAFGSNRDFARSAEDAAENLLTDLVRSWNPDIPDLQVVVEFVE